MRKTRCTLRLVPLLLLVKLLYFCLFVLFLFFFRRWVRAQPSPAATRAPAGLLISARSPGRGELSLVSIHFSMVVHGIRLAPPLSLTPTAVRLLGLQIGGKGAVPPPGMQRRLTREPHVTEVGQSCAESEGLFNSSLRSPPLSQRATERVCPPSAAGPRSGTSAGTSAKTQNNLEETRVRE